jgi:hypothetical protein
MPVLSTQAEAKPPKKDPRQKTKKAQDAFACLPGFLRFFTGLLSRTPIFGDYDSLFIPLIGSNRLSCLKARGPTQGSLATGQ